MILNKGRQFQIIFLISLLAIFFRFVYLQIYKHQQHEERAGANSIRKISLHAPRGIIFDRFGIALVDNLQIYDLVLIPFDVTDKFDYDFISQELSLSKEDLVININKTKRTFNRFRPKIIKRHINFETRSRLEENKLELPGMIFEEFPGRIYPNNARLTHVLGYLRTIADHSNKIMKESYKFGDVYGFSGIEKVYESILRGKDGAEFHLVDIYGIDHGLVSDTPPILPIPGKSVHLSINSKLQTYVETLFGSKKGAVICMDPKSGDILAYISFPDYDLNSFVGPVPKDIWNLWNDDKQFPLLNRVIQGLYPPGSTMKLIAAALAIEEQIVGREWKVNCNGEYQLGDRIFHCWNLNGHGKVNMHSAIINSCNIYFYQLMQKLPFEKWQEMSKNFGFGHITGIDLFGEEKGHIPNIEYMNEKYGKYGWATGNLLTFVIGQGDVLVTPIQVLQMMNLIATKGETSKPKLNKNIMPTKFKLSLKNSTWELLQESLWSVVNNDKGTGKLAKLDGVDVFGKTGTAQNPHGDDHSWFSGYMEINNTPVISLVVLIENGGKGSIDGAKISRKIFSFFKENEIIK